MPLRQVSLLQIQSPPPQSFAEVPTLNAEQLDRSSNQISYSTIHLFDNRWLADSSYAPHACPSHEPVPGLTYPNQAREDFRFFDLKGPFSKTLGLTTK
jgi:hypothetical protein